MSDINIGEISEALNDKMDRDGGNPHLPCAVVVSSQLPSADNGYTWFRLYSDGWVEQGGRVQLNGQISSTNKRVSFPITMANRAYFSLASQDANTPYTSFVGWQGTTGMSVGTNGSSTTGTTSWLVCGMAAQGV